MSETAPLPFEEISASPGVYRQAYPIILRSPARLTKHLFDQRLLVL
jgi:hypothetical protein